MLLSLEAIRTALRLGLANVARVVTYRTLLRAGWYARRLPVGQPVRGPFLEWPTEPVRSVPEGIDAEAWAEDAARVLSGKVPAFSNGWREVGFPPRWSRSVVNAAELSAPSGHWSELPDFTLPGGDVKGFWEPARFDGLLCLALGWLATGDERSRVGLHEWLEHWSAQNPANSGVQWKCAQETSIRLMTLLLVVTLLERRGGARPTPGLRDLAAEHCARIARTMLYAIGQDNNHGTSEAAALFVGGSFLAGREGAHEGDGSRWARAGRARLEERVARLFMEDGSFSQNSVNYHRMALDTLSFVEAWRRLHELDAFSSLFYERCRAATEWLQALTERRGGDAPNLGANDGTRLFTLHRLPYRDHRPSVAWASALFQERSPYGRGPWDEPLRWLGLPEPSEPGAEPRPPRSTLLPEGGYARLAVPGAWALVRLPVYRFRPSHSDALHVDLWVGGENVLRDGGSFSYNTDPTRWTYYTGPASHNTVHFDGRDQMPRLSRFLFGRWLEAEEVSFDTEGATVSSSYRDYRGAVHARRVRLEPGRCVVEDSVRGFQRAAVVRWRLRPGNWAVADAAVESGGVRLAVEADVPIVRFELVEGLESRHYQEESTLPVVEAEVAAAARLRTEVTWHP